MIAIVNMACGLANRMFQYSYYLYLKKLDWDVSIDYTRKASLPHEHVDWDRIFPFAPLTEASSLKVLLLGGGSSIVSKFRRHYLRHTTRVINMPSAFSADLPYYDNSYLIGVFQNAKMVESISDEVRNAFMFNPFTDEDNLSLENKLINTPSVGIHVRKGEDYRNRVWYQNTCPLSYYMEAIKLIRKLVKNPQFFVFTDNPQWVKESFQGIEYTMILNNPKVGWGSHYDMQLMSYCHHNIISNSTYSWWGAFLNHNSEKIVICPNAWFNPNSCNDWTSKDVLCDNWITL